MLLLSISTISGLVAVLAACVLYLRLRRTPVGSPRMAELGSYIALGVSTYLTRQFRTILLFAPLPALLIWVFIGP